MVTKYDINGHPYREPPYTWEEEQEFYRRFCGAKSLTVVKGPPLEKRQKCQQPQAGPKPLPKRHP